MTLAGAPLGAPPRHFWRSLLRRSSGSRFREPAFAPTRPAGSLQSGPSAARAEPRSRPSAGLRGLPAGAALAPSAERLRKTPLSERGGRICPYFPSKVNIILGLSSHKFVKCWKDRGLYGAISEAHCANLFKAWPRNGAIKRLRPTDLVLRAYDEAGYSGTKVDLWDLIDWLQAGLGRRAVFGHDAGAPRTECDFE